MIEQTLQLSSDKNLKNVMFLTDLTEIEIEAIVGRKSGKLRGEVVVHNDGSVEIRNRQTKKVLWST